ncbi:MAG TPA: hypothetical protein DCR04_09615 [Flavobacteriales bacterium]|nr:hypothetical protein [Flavobacteriales bacterium]
MKNLISLLALIGLVVLGASSCNTIEDNNAPVIIMMSPLATKNPYISGMPIRLRLEARDDFELHEIVISVVREHDSKEVYLKYGHSHGSVFSLLVDTMFTTSVNSDFTFKAIVSDHEGEETVATETFHMHPM